MKKFDIPDFFRSSVISRIKDFRKNEDPRKKNFTPTTLDFGSVRFFIARHFGFCYGVENAIEIAYKAIEENSGNRIFLLSEMIHNPEVNNDLLSKGVKFLMDTSGKYLINWNELTFDDIVIIPAFGTTLGIEKKLNEIGIDPYRYNTTCPFVEKVWNRSAQIGEQDYTVIIHGKHYHEETRATFSHSIKSSPALIVKDIDETKILKEIILRERDKKDFYKFFEGRYSPGFDPEKDLKKIGVVNQTTMLAIETQAIADYLKQTIIQKYGMENSNKHFADTKDTLCYATYDNQLATIELLSQKADFAVVVGGYNSSNTGHLVELCEKKITTYFISDDEKIISPFEIKHYDINSKKEILIKNFVPEKEVVDIILTSGASCPDAVLNRVLQKLLACFENTAGIETVLLKFMAEA
jgi:4-hydroxy-3-methylbut-2-en-1-yl diphosphate reductase